MEKEITLEKFVNEYTQRATDKIKEDYIRDTLNVTKYIEFAQKASIAENLVKRTTYVVDDKGNVTDTFQVNSLMRYMFFTLSVIDMYTNIIINWDNAVNEYDLLAENGLIGVLVSKIPEQELNEFQTIVNMVLDDIMQNEFTTQQFIRKEISRIEDVVKLLTPVIEPIIKSVADNIESGIVENTKE